MVIVDNSFNDFVVPAPLIAEIGYGPSSIGRHGPSGADSAS
jgi:hypothetical protein